MATSILENLTSSLTPRQTEHLAKMLDVKPAQLPEGIFAAGALLLGAVRQHTATPKGADELLASLTQDKELRTGVMEAIEAGHGYPILDFLFGVGLSKVETWVRDTAKIDVAPFLAPVAVLLMHQLEEKTRAEKFDAAGLTTYLNAEQETFARTKPQLASQVSAALDLGQNTVERAERIMERFTPEEWDALATLPAVAASAVMMSALSGPVGLNREYGSLFRSLAASAAANGFDSLAGLAAMTYNEPAKIDALGVTQANAQTRMRDACLQALAILTDKATHEELVLYKSMVVKVATDVAQATNDGGILGLGGKPISGDEKRTLELLAAALAYKI